MRYIAITILSLLLFSCTNNIDKSITTLKVVETTDTIFLSQIVSSIEYIPLETPPGIYINRASKIILFNDKFFTISNEQIFIFDRNGKYLSKINRKGRGPNEYLSIMDFCVNPDDGTLCLITRSEKYNIDKYDLSGNFVQRIPMDVFSFRAEVFNGILYSFNDGEREKCVNLIDINTGKLQESFLEVRGIGDRPMPIVNSYYFSKSDDELYFTRALSNTIYSVSTTGVVPKFSLDFGSKNFPEKILKENKLTDDNIANFRNRYTTIETYTVTPEFLHFIYIDNGVKFGYYFFDNKELLVSPNYKNDIVENGFPPYRYKYNDGMIFCAVDALEILSYFKMNFSTYSNKEIETLATNNSFVKMATNLNESDNPVIIVAKCK